MITAAKIIIWLYSVAIVFFTIRYFENRFEDFNLKDTLIYAASVILYLCGFAVSAAL